MDLLQSYRRGFSSTNFWSLKSPFYCSCREPEFKAASCLTRSLGMAEPMTLDLGKNFASRWECVNTRVIAEVSMGTALLNKDCWKAVWVMALHDANLETRQPSPVWCKFTNVFQNECKITKICKKFPEMHWMEIAGSVRTQRWYNVVSCSACVCVSLPLYSLSPSAVVACLVWDLDRGCIFSLTSDIVSAWLWVAQAFAISNTHCLGLESLI